MLPLACLASLALVAPVAASGDIHSTAELRAAHKKAGAEESVARRDGPIVHPTVYIDTIVHVIAKPKHDISLESIKRQIDVLNESFKSANFSFIVQDIDWYELDDWYISSISNFHKGDNSSLNLFISDYIGGASELGATPRNSPEGINLWSSALAGDGCAALGATMPGGSKEFNKQGKVAVHEVGHWLGLMHTFEGGCEGDGDFIDDTPATKRHDVSHDCPVDRNSCPDKPGSDPVHNFMDYSNDGCMREFTPHQIDRMHSLWRMFRSQPNDTQPRPWRLWNPIKPVWQRRKRFFYHDPWNMNLAKQKCQLGQGPDRDHREEYCGSTLFCERMLYQAGNNQEAYANAAECLQARADPRSKGSKPDLRPWLEPSGPGDAVQNCIKSRTKEVCGTGLFCSLFRLPTHYSSSAECLAARTPPQGKLRWKDPLRNVDYESCLRTSHEGLCGSERYCGLFDLEIHSSAEGLKTIDGDEYMSQEECLQDFHIFTKAF